jgi:hypothetical protein
MTENEMATSVECRRRSTLVGRSVETPTLSHAITVSQKQSSSVFNQLSQSRLDRVFGSRRAAVSGAEEDA